MDEQDKGCYKANMGLDIPPPQQDLFGQFLDDYQVAGDALDIVHYPDPVLSKKAGEVEVFDQKLEKLARDMLYSMYTSPGIGLAAPQVGLSLRMFVIDVDYKREKIAQADGQIETVFSELNPKVFINPKIVGKDGEKKHEEGCLSLPGVFEEVVRANSIVVDYCNLNGKACQIEASELLSICIQHENDHLDGIVFIDHLSSFKRSFYKKKLTKEKRRLKS